MIGTVGFVKGAQLLPKHKNVQQLFKKCDHGFTSMEPQCIFYMFYSNLDVIDNRAPPCYGQVSFGLSISYLFNVNFLFFRYRPFRYIHF